MSSPLAVTRLRRIADYLIDPRVGILTQVREVRAEAGFPNYFQYSAEVCNTRAMSPHAGHRWTMSAAVDREAAAAAAITEGVASYCATQRREEDDRRPVTAAAMAPFPCVPPGDFALFDGHQYEGNDFPYFPFEDSTPVHWMPGLDVMADTIVHVPSAMVFLPYETSWAPGEVPVTAPSSMGLACDFGPARTALRAVCDAVQCDALAIAWQAKIQPAQVRVETLSDANYDRIVRFERTGSGQVALLFLDLGLQPPTFLAVHRSQVPGAPSLVFAAGTDPDPEAGIRRSLESLAHALYYCRMLNSQAPEVEPGPGYESVREQLHHLRFWCDGENAPLAGFVFAAEERLSFDEIPGIAEDGPQAQLRKVLEGLAAAGHRTVLVDLTTPDVRALGLWVLRAVVPGLHPLFMGHERRALGGSRLWEVPRKLGHPGVDRDSGDNPLPHPFSRKGVV